MGLIYIISVVSTAGGILNEFRPTDGDSTGVTFGIRSISAYFWEVQNSEISRGS